MDKNQARIANTDRADLQSVRTKKIKKLYANKYYKHGLQIRAIRVA